MSSAQEKRSACTNIANIGDIHDLKTFVFPADTFLMARQGRIDAQGRTG